MLTWVLSHTNSHRLRFTRSLPRGREGYFQRSQYNRSTDESLQRLGPDRLRSTVRLASRYSRSCVDHVRVSAHTVSQRASSSRRDLCRTLGLSVAQCRASEHHGTHNHGVVSCQVATHAYGPYYAGGSHVLCSTAWFLSDGDLLYR